MQTIKIIIDAWDEVKLLCMNFVWHKKKKKDSSVLEIDDTFTAVREEIANLGTENDFERMNKSDIDEVSITTNYLTKY